MDADIRRGRTLTARVRAHAVNPVVRRLLRSPAHRVLSGSVLLLAYTGRRSGVRRELPAMYAGLGDRFVVVPGQPATKTWWRNFVGDVQPVTVTVAGRRDSCQARLLEPRTAEHQLALDAYRKRYPHVPVEDATPVLVLTPVRNQDPDGAGRRRADALEEHR
jgi:F420H(2)-dependent quinone reductase